jgi:CheY-like chemotaxis protein
MIECDRSAGCPPAPLYPRALEQRSRPEAGALGTNDMTAQEILVVDDDPVVTRMLCRVLSNHSVVVAHSGKDAIERLRKQDFYLILCDLTMPGMNGMEFYETVQAISGDLAKRVVFMTGGAFTAESHEFLSRLPNTWLEKPFDIGELRELVNSRAPEH